MMWYESSPRYWFRFGYQTRKFTLDSRFTLTTLGTWSNGCTIHDPTDAPYMIQRMHHTWSNGCTTSSLLNRMIVYQRQQVITSPSLAAPGIDGSFLSQGLWSSQEDLWTQQPQAVPGEMCLTWHFGDENGRCGNCPENWDKRGCFVFWRWVCNQLELKEQCTKWFNDCSRMHMIWKHIVNCYFSKWFIHVYNNISTTTRPRSMDPRRLRRSQPARQWKKSCWPVTPIAW